MKILTSTGPIKDSPNAVAVFLFDDEIKAPRLSALDRATCKDVVRLIAASKFKGKKDELVRHYSDRSLAPLLILHGLGSRRDFNWQRLRYATGAVIRDARDRGARNVIFISEDRIAADFPAAEIMRALVDGVILGNWRFDFYKKAPDKDRKDIASVTIHFASTERKDDAQRALPRLRVMAECTTLARNWSTHPTNVITTGFLATEAVSLERAGLKVTVFERPDLERMGMNLMLAVARGSAMPPRLVVLDWHPRGAKDSIAFVGKGMVFDSGGLNIKTASMEEMKSDMSGAAAVLGAMTGIAELQPPVRVLGVMALTENAIGPDAYRPSDIYTAYNGKTVEITNTDAEGRLVLADALAFVADQFRPGAIVDVATLTGAAKIALGSYASAIFSNNDNFQRAVMDAAVRAGERMWPMPLYDEYSDEIKSEVAQLRNAVINHRWGGACTGAAFLKEFVGETPWVHIDIAPTSYPGHVTPIQPKATATGVGVRTLLELVTS